MRAHFAAALLTCSAVQHRCVSPQISASRYVKSQTRVWVPVIDETDIAKPTESLAYLWYRRRASIAHISSSQKPSETRAFVTRDFRRLVHAHQILSDPRKRTAWESTFFSAPDSYPPSASSQLTAVRTTQVAAERPSHASSLKSACVRSAALVLYSFTFASILGAIA